MRCTNKAATKASARMRAVGEQVNQNSAAGVSSPAAADKQSAIPNVAGARGHPRAASSYADSAAGGSPIDVSSEIKVVYSGESDPRLTRILSQSPAVKLWMRERRLLSLLRVS